MRKHPLIMQTSTKNPRSQAKIFLQSKLQVFESLEGLNSPLAYSGGELWPYPNWMLFTPG